MFKPLLSLAAMMLTFWLFIPYIRSIRRNTVKPHVFSWLIWSLGTLIVFFAQLSAGGGIGAWAIGLSGLITCLVTWLAWRNRGDTHITSLDWIFFISALSALPFWFITANPLCAVLILTTVDVLGFGPTMRRAWKRPHEESVQFFALATVRNGLVLLALETQNLTTILFPAATGIGCLILVLMILCRRML